MLESISRIEISFLRWAKKWNRRTDKWFMGVSRIWKWLTQDVNWGVLLIFVAHVALGLYFWFEEVPVFAMGWAGYW